MTVLGLPATKKPASIALSLEHNAAVLRNPLGNTIQRLMRSGPVWRANVQYPPMVGDDAGIMAGWMDQAARPDRWFYLENPGSIGRGALAPTNLVGNGTFRSNADGWTAESGVTLSVNARRLKVANASGSPGVAAGAYASLTLAAGFPHTVVVDFDAGSGQSATVQIRNASTLAVEASRKLTSPGRFVFSVTPSQAAMQIRLVNNSDGHLYFRNVSVHRSMLVQGSANTGNRINVDGLPVSTNAVLKAGEMFCVRCGGNFELKRLRDDLDSDSGGNGMLVFEPALRVTPDDNEAVTIWRPFGRFFIPQHVSASAISPPADQPIHGYGFEALEDVTAVADAVDVTDASGMVVSPFSFADQTGVAASTAITSDPITISGTGGAATITVTGGEYSINGGAFTSAAGTVIAGDQVRARHTSSASSETATNTVVTIGGVSDTFTSTTRYLTTASDYDGTNDYQTRGANLTGIADGKQGLLSFWARVDGGDGSELRILAGNTPRFDFKRSSSNRWDLVGQNAAGATILRLTTASTNQTTSAAYRHIIASWDLATAGARHLYVNDTSDLSVVTFTDDTIDYTDTNVGIGARSDGVSKFNGCLSEIFFHTSYLDISVEANRRKFISAAGKPVSLGANGSTPLGVQPLIYAPNGDASTNKGSGGNFTVTGSLDVASSSPSD